MKNGAYPCLPLVVETVDLARPDLAQASIALDQAAAARAKITDVDCTPLAGQNTP